MVWSDRGNLCVNVKNSLPRDRNTEQGHIFKINFMYFVIKKIKAITKTRNLKTTKIFMVFFVVSTFRDFVIKDLFLFRFIRVWF